jgi:hypothetical protein
MFTVRTPGPPRIGTCTSSGWFAPYPPQHPYDKKSGSPGLTIGAGGSGFSFLKMLTWVKPPHFWFLGDYVSISRLYDCIDGYYAFPMHEREHCNSDTIAATGPRAFPQSKFFS